MAEVSVTEAATKFTQTHEWVRLEGEVATIGVSEFAQKELGDIVYVEVPETGKILKAGDEVAVLESTKAAADVYSPLSGEIVEVNSALEESPDRVNLSPEQDGWLFKLKLADMAELERLMSADEYKKLVS